MSSPPEGRAAFPASLAAGWYAWFKAAVFALLVLNTGILLLAGTPSEVLDATAWLVLLALFELETGYGGSPLHGRAHAVMTGARLVAAAAVVAAAIGYLVEDDRLDAINSALWVAVVILLELEVRYLRPAAAYRRVFAAAAAALYCALGMLVLVWAWRGAWFDAYDALLWLVAFATIELNLLQRSAGLSPASGTSRKTPP